jgi:catechol 2,3-dioxygenase-like lactoylglutathione lyase family enzyme
MVSSWEMMADFNSRTPNQRRPAVLLHFDHVTIVVEEVDEAIDFFGLLGFIKEKDLVISGEKFSSYLLVEEMEARHVTLVLEGRLPRQEIQLLHYIKPLPQKDPNIARLDKLGYNHLCFAVDDIEAMATKLKNNGVTMLNEIMQFNDRKLVFFRGPGGITLELAQWTK